LLAAGSTSAAAAPRQLHPFHRPQTGPWWPQPIIVVVVVVVIVVVIVVVVVIIGAAPLLLLGVGWARVV
jgi:hypothetical protein